MAMVIQTSVFEICSKKARCLFLGQKYVLKEHNIHNINITKPKFIIWKMFYEQIN